MDMIYLGLRGSHLYGTTTEDSDVDLVGVQISPLEDVIRGRLQDNRSYETPFDVRIVELRTFVEDLISGQPYAIELVCQDPIIGNPSDFDPFCTSNISGFEGIFYNAIHQEEVSDKDLYHGLRVGIEAVEYLKHGGIVFPLDDAKFLRRVKRGGIDGGNIDDKIADISHELDTIKEVAPPDEPQVNVDAWLKGAYHDPDAF